MIQQLTQAVQNMLTILQSAGQAGAAGVPPTSEDPTAGTDADPGMPPGGAAGAMDDDDDMDDDMDEDDAPPAPGQPPAGGAAPPPVPGGAPAAGNVSGAGSLHDRISNLETHTGLKKSASNATLADRLDALEEDLLGGAFDGPTVARVEQLEKAVRGSVAIVPEVVEEPEAPESIDLGELIKTAIAEVEAKFSAKLDDRLGKSAEIPSVESLRGTPRVGARRSTATAIDGDAALVKSAQNWGMDADLDAPVSFGDLLRLQYQAQIGGLLTDEDEGDEAE